MQLDPNILNHPGLAPLWESMERSRRQQQYAAVGLMILGLVVVVVGIVGLNLYFPFVGGMMATGGLYWFYHILTNQPRSQWYRQLRDEPDSIVWVYGLVTERMPFGFKTVSTATIHLIDTGGDIHAFGLKPAELKMVTKTLNRVLPKAEFGYSPVLELKYRGEVTNFRNRKEEELF